MMRRKTQMYLLLGCSILYLDFVVAKSLANGSKDLVAAASDNRARVKYFKRGDGHDYENGYSKSSEDKGTGGYDKFEEFEKKDGDKYDYEKHEEFGKLKKDDSDENDYEEGYKFSHSSSYKHGDHDDGHNDAYSNGGSGESNESGYGESESYRRSYSEADSESEESEDEDSDHGETRDTGIVYGKHPSGKILVKQPTNLYKSAKSTLAPQSSTSTHNQYMVFDDGSDATTSKKYPKKSTKHTVTPLQPKKHVQKPDHHRIAHDSATPHVDNLRGYSSYVVHQMPRDSQIGHAISSSLVNVGTSIQVAGNGNYNEAEVDLHGYPDLKQKTAGGYMNTRYTPHRPGHVLNAASEDNSSDESGGSDDYDDRNEQPYRQKPRVVYHEEVDYK